MGLGDHKIPGISQLELLVELCRVGIACQICPIGADIVSIRCMKLAGEFVGLLTLNVPPSTNILTVAGIFVRCVPLLSFWALGTSSMTCNISSEFGDGGSEGTRTNRFREDHIFAASGILLYGASLVLWARPHEIKGGSCQYKDIGSIEEPCPCMRNKKIEESGHTRFKMFLVCFCF